MPRAPEERPGPAGRGGLLVYGGAVLRPGTFSLSIAPVIAAVLAAFAIIALDGAAHAQAVTATSPGTRPVLTAEQKAQLTSQIAAGQRASRRAGSYARRGKTRSISPAFKTIS